MAMPLNPNSEFETADSSTTSPNLGIWVQTIFGLLLGPDRVCGRVGVAARVTGRVALLRDRRCTFIEREQAKGVNAG